MTFADKCNNYKDEIKHALNNEVIAGYDDKGSPVYEKTDKKETSETILRIFDEVVYQALDALASGRALERLYKEKTGEDPSLKDYMRLEKEEKQKYNDYIYEHEGKKIIRFPE